MGGARIPGTTQAEGCPEVIRDLDLRRPALLEASAGTGKTYAIEHLVLRILTEIDGMELGHIVVLTFTDKATGELKEKIRSRLAGRVASAAASGELPPSVLGRLRDAVLNFDRARISTIHGFCQRVLRDFAFENQALFHHELADDADVFDRALTEEMRSTWLSDSGPCGAGLEGFRRLAGRMGMDASGQWKRKWLDIARNYNPFRGDRLLPEPDPDRLRSLDAEILEAFAALQGILGDTVPGEERNHPFYAPLKASSFSKAGRRAASLGMLESLQSLIREAAAGTSGETRLAALLRFLEDNSRLGIMMEGFQRMRPDSWSAGAPAPAGFEGMIEAMDRIRTAAREREAAARAMDFEPQREVLGALRARARAYKREHGLHSYDDMIQDLCRALRERPELKLALRRQFRYGIVDEFQDTDPLQWEIFRTVFLESEGSNPLYLIGDPKQAIYGFRGGDIHTYMDARGEMHARSAHSQAAGLSLDGNFRSSRRMVSACNLVFSHPGWFRKLAATPGDTSWRLPAEADPLGYTDVRYGGLPAQECGEEAGADPAPFLMRDFSGENLKQSAQRKIHLWIAGEILRLMGPGPKLRIPDGSGGSRPLDWGDLCVLVRAGYEKRALEAVFQKASIPYQVHKSAGLYQSEASGHFLAVLESLQDPADGPKHTRALLTRFFRASDQGPPNAPPADIHPAFEAWKRLADRRQWQRLLHAMLHRTGLLYRESLEADGDRRAMDYIHLGQDLVREALRDNLSLGALVQRFKEWRRESPDPDEERHFHREDSESRKVAIMTMHTSKGLEFPVVFLAGLAGGKAPAYYRYHDKDGTVFHLDKEDAQAEAAARREEEHEERRLFYVAFTRARYKLYIPIPPAQFARKACPLGGFVATALRAAAAAQPELFRQLDPEDDFRAFPAAAAVAAGHPAPGVADSGGGGNEPDTRFLADFPGDASFSGPRGDFSRRRRRVSSYSLLARLDPGVATEELDGRYDKEDASVPGAGVPDEEETAAMRASVQGNALPRGRETGNMFHEILEHVDFAFIAAADGPEAILAHAPTRDIIAAGMAAHSLEETHLGDVARVVWNTLRTPVLDAYGGEPFALGAVSERRHEMEFLFPHPPGQGYLWGYIDLVFRHRGRFYMLDWKSNWLETYRPSDLEPAMRESRYDLQYKLYSLAVDRWLRSILPGYDYERDFGGIYYIYLRGMGPEGSGAYVLRPTREEISRDYPAELDRVLGATGVAGATGAAVALGAAGGTGIPNVSQVLPDGAGPRTAGSRA